MPGIGADNVLDGPSCQEDRFAEPLGTLAENVAQEPRVRICRQLPDPEGHVVAKFSNCSHQRFIR
jgi:hypothetical protein